MKITMDKFIDKCLENDIDLPLSIGLQLCELFNDLVGEPEDSELKRKMILVNGIEVPAPETEKPNSGMYYIPAPSFECKYDAAMWGDYDSDNRLLKEGLIYLDEKDATARAKAMMKWKER